MTIPCLRMYPVDVRERLVGVAVAVSTSMAIGAISVAMGSAAASIATCVANGAGWSAAAVMLGDGGPSGVVCPAPACAGSGDDAAAGAALGWPQAASPKKRAQSIVMPSVSHRAASERGGGKATVVVGSQVVFCHSVTWGVILQRIMASG